MLKVTLILIICCVSVHTKDFPKYLMDLRCHLDKDFDTCFVKNGNLAIPLVARGDPENHIPKMDPMEMDFINLISTPNLNLNLTHLKIYGLQNLRIMNNTKFNWDQGIWTVTLRSSNLTLHGQYEVDGKIMIMPIKGNGDFSLFCKNGAFKASFTSYIVNRDNVSYYQPTGVRIDYHFDKIEFDFENLFEGNEQLGQEVNRFLNDNWDLLLIDFGPGISNTISTIISNIFMGFSKDVPVDYFFI